MSIRINDQWRICFRWVVRDAEDVETTDLRPCKFFGLTEGYFLRLQNAYDTLEAKRQIAREMAKIKRYKSDKAA
jgi:antitoxin HigA-1